MLSKSRPGLLKIGLWAFNQGYSDLWYTPAGGVLSCSQAQPVEVVSGQNTEIIVLGASYNRFPSHPK